MKLPAGFCRIMNSMLPYHLLILCIIITTTAGCVSAPPPDQAGPVAQIAALLPGATKAKAVESPGKISRAELQQEVMAFADEYAVAI